MATGFAIGDAIGHVVGDPQCPQCIEEYPESCPCGGLIHAAEGESDSSGTEWPATRCDRCGCSEEQIH